MTTGTGPATHRWTVRAHLVLIAVTALLLTTAAVGYGYLWSVDRARDDATGRMRTQARIGVREITDTLSGGLAQVDGVARSPGVAAVFERPEGCVLQLAATDAFTEARLGLVDPAGQVACSSVPDLIDGGPPPDAEAEWLDDALAAGSPTVLWPTVDAVTGRPAVVVARAVPGPDGGTAGAAVLVLPAEPVAATLAASLALPVGAAVVVVDRATGRVVSSSDRTLARPGDTAFAANRDAGPWAGPDGRARVLASADVEGLGWRVYAGLDGASVTAAARGTLARQALTGAGALGVLVLALVLLERRVAGPLAALTRGAVQARDDAGAARVPEAGTAETAALARAFNSMLDIRAGQEARLAYSAAHDRLTGLPNAEAFRTRLDAVLARDLEASDGPPGTPPDTSPDTSPDAAPGGSSGGPRRLVVLCVGLDRFQAVSDGVGPDGADAVLVEVASRLRSVLGPDDALARGDGQQFLVMCEGRTVDDAVALAERIHLVVEEPLRWPAPGVAMQASTGLAVPRPDDEPAVADELVRQATTAMGNAQARGRTWSLFDDSMRVMATQHLQTENGLRRALAQDELTVHYQPIVETSTGRLLGAEALVRWQHPERGLVPPLEFIGVAERTGQIGEVGALVLERACAQAAAWLPALGPLTMSVNVSAQQLLDDDFAGHVEDVLRRTGLPPGLLCLEVTESVVIRRVGGGADTLHRLRRLGVQVAVDDFGTGYSSLSYLRDLPITSLKIDRSFITRLEHDDRDRHLVDAVLGMAGALGLTVVAEGVETAGQQRMLEGLGCGSAQGFLFGRPCPPGEFGALVQAARALPDAS